VKGLAIAVTVYGMIKLTYIVYSMLAQTFAKLGRTSFLFNLDKRQLRAPWTNTNINDESPNVAQRRNHL